MAPKSTAFGGGGKSISLYLWGGIGWGAGRRAWQRVYRQIKISTHYTLFSPTSTPHIPKFIPKEALSYEADYNNLDNKMYLPSLSSPISFSIVSIYINPPFFLSFFLLPFQNKKRKKIRERERERAGFEMTKGQTERCANRPALVFAQDDFR